MRKRVRIISMIMATGIVLAATTHLALAGDYTLYISNDPNALCAPPIGGRDSLSNPVRSAAEVAADISRYFRGEPTKIPIFEAAFANGHVQFCGQQESQAVYEALVGVCLADSLENEPHLYDFSYVLASHQLRRLVHSKLAARDAASREAKRFQRMLDRIDASLVERTCVKPKAFKSETLLAVVYDEADRPAIAVWGRLEARESPNRVIASTFEVVRCSQHTVLLALQSLETAVIESQVNGLLVTFVLRLPFGPNWSWLTVPVREFVVPVDTSIRVAGHLVLAPPELTPTEIADVLALYERIRANGAPASEPAWYEDLVWRTLACALAGDTVSQSHLARMGHLLPIDRNAGAMLKEAQDIYQAYAEESGIVPRLAIPPYGPPAGAEEDR